MSGSTIKFPKVNVPITGANAALENSQQRVLVIGQKRPSGNAAVGVLLQDIPVASNELAALVGGDGMLYQMLNDMRELNSVCAFDLIVVPDGVAATASQGLFAFAGTNATEDGTITATIGSKRKFTVDVPVETGDTPADIAAALDVAFAAITNKPFTTGLSGNNTTVQMNDLGEVYNRTGLSIDIDGASGITASITAMSGGTVNPDLQTGVADIFPEIRYQTVVSPYPQSATPIVDVLDARFNADGNVLDGVLCVAYQDSFANISALVTPENSNSLVVFCDEWSAGDYPAIFEFESCLAAQSGAIRAIRRQPDVNIAQFVITRNGALDAIGGPAISSKPYANTSMPLLPIIAATRGFNQLEISQLNIAGASVLGNNKAANGVIMGQVVTTYKTDSAGNADITYKYLNYVDTASAGREYIFNNLQSDYAQSRLTDGDLIKGRSMANAQSIAATIVGYYQTLADSDFVIARKGQDILAFFKENLSVSVDLASGSVTVVFTLPIVTQLRNINAPMSLTFNIE